MPTAKAIEAHKALFKSESRYILDYGGRGSGKSVAAAQAFLIRASSRKGRALAVRKVARTLRVSVWPLLLSTLSSWHWLGRCKINKTEMSIKFPNGAEVNCVGMDDAEKIKSVEGAWLAWIEEADSLTEADFDAIDFSLRSGGDTILATFNPPPAVPGVPHWIKARFIDRKDNDATVIKTTWRDNPFLPTSYTRRLEDLANTNPELYKMWALGEFVGLSGAVFSDWGIVDKIPDDAEPLGYGLDFGFSVDPAALIACYRYNGEYYHREVVYETGLTNADLIKRMREAGVTKTDEIVADSAEPKSIEDLRRAGYHVRPAVKGPDSVRAGIDYMRQYRHNIERGSEGLIKEFGAYSWATGKDGSPKPVPVDAYNHGIDAIRYRIYRKQAKPSLAQLPGL